MIVMRKTRLVWLWEWRFGGSGSCNDLTNTRIFDITFKYYSQKDINNHGKINCQDSLRTVTMKRLKKNTGGAARLGAVFFYHEKRTSKTGISP